MFKKISTALWVAIIFLVTIIGIIIYIAVQDANVLDKSNIRSGLIDIKMIDQNNDGYVYQDSMEVNVISDIPGICPYCFMETKKVTNIEAIKILIEHNFEVVK